MGESCNRLCVFFALLTLYGLTKTAEQQTITQQCGDWYTGRWWVGCYIWYSEDGSGRAAAPPSTLLAVPNVTAAHPTASVLTSYYSTWHFTIASALQMVNYFPVGRSCGPAWESCWYIDCVCTCVIVDIDIIDRWISDRLERERLRTLAFIRVRPLGKSSPPRCPVQDV